MSRSWQIQPPTIIFGARGVDDPRASQPPQASCTSVWPPMPAVLDPPQRDPSKKHTTSREELGRISERKQKYYYSLPAKGGWESPPGGVRWNGNNFSLDFGTKDQDGHNRVKSLRLTDITVNLPRKNYTKSRRLRTWAVRNRNEPHFPRHNTNPRTLTHLPTFLSQASIAITIIGFF